MDDLKIHTTRITYKNILCHFRLLIYSDTWLNIRKKDYCPICNMPLKKNDEFYLTINNSRLFPNCLVHSKCVSQIDSVGLTFMNFAEATETIYNNYKAYKTLCKPWDNR